LRRLTSGVCDAMCDRIGQPWHERRWAEGAYGLM
jgi:hypothetical protein